MKQVKILVYTLVLVLLSINSSGQSGLKINLKLDGLNDSLLLLASYTGDKQFVVDTIYPDKNFNYRISKDTLVPEGMYFFASSKKSKILDFIISGKQDISITGNIKELPHSLVSKSNDENNVLFEYIQFLSLKQKEMADLQKMKNTFVANSDSASVVMNQINMVNEEVQRYITGIINRNHGKFISLFLKSMQEPEFTPPPLLENGRIDSISAFRTYRNHYWDNIDLSDDRTIRTPIIHNKIEHYLQGMIVPVPDSINAAIDMLFEMSEGNKETFKYLMWYLTVKYESSDIMGHDAVFVQLVDKYYDNDKMMSWMNPTVKENLIQRAKILKPILIGEIAPEMILLDTLKNPVSLHSIKNRYTIIYFWDPECSHCKKETPQLVSFYNDFKDIYNLAVYAVCMDTSWTDMSEYIQKNHMQFINVNGFYSMTSDFRELYDVHSSPVMYLLDQNKKIVAKRVLTEQMKSIIMSQEN